MIFQFSFSSSLSHKSSQPRPRDGPDVATFIFALPISIKPNHSLHSSSLLLNLFVDSSSHNDHQNSSFRHVSSDLFSSLRSLTPSTIKNEHTMTLTIASALISALASATEGLTSEFLLHVCVLPPPPVTPLVGAVRLWSIADTENLQVADHFNGGPTNYEKQDAHHVLEEVRNGFLGVAPSIVSSYIVSLGMAMSTQLLAKIEATGIQKKMNDVFFPFDSDIVANALISSDDTLTKRKHETAMHQSNLLETLLPSTQILTNPPLAPALMRAMFNWSRVSRQAEFVQIAIGWPSMVTSTDFSHIYLNAYDAPCFPLMKNIIVPDRKDFFLDHIHLLSSRHGDVQSLGRLMSPSFCIPTSDINRIMSTNPFDQSRCVTCIEHIPTVGSANVYLSLLKKRLRVGFESLVQDSCLLRDRKRAYTKDVRVSAGLITQMMRFPLLEHDDDKNDIFLPLSLPQFDETETNDPQHHFEDRLLDENELDEKKSQHQQKQQETSSWCWEQPHDEASEGMIDSRDYDIGLRPLVQRMPSPPEAQSSNGPAPLDFKLSSKRM